MCEPAWLTCSRELQAIAQTGLTFTHDPYDRQRFERVRELAAAMMAEGACELTGGQSRPRLETTEVGFFERTALPELSGGRITTAQISAMFEYAAQRHLPTAFD